MIYYVARGYGGIGRRVRFRFLWPQGRAGSTPVTRTRRRKNEPRFYREFVFFSDEIISALHAEKEFIYHASKKDTYSRIRRRKKQIS